MKDLIEDVGLYKGCSAIELFALILINLSILIPTAIILIDKVLIAIVISFIISLIGVKVLAGFLQTVKRNKPELFFSKKVFKFFNISSGNLYSFHSREN